MKNSSLELVDTHCHIHGSEFADKFNQSQDQMVKEALEAGVSKLICVGTDAVSSQEAVDFAARYDNCYASLALHPHEAAKHTELELSDSVRILEDIADKNQERLVAIGECGLDYYYHDDQETRDRQEFLLRLHIELALRLGLPMIFHIRDAFEDFFKIIDEYEGIKGVVHSFTAGTAELQGSIDRGLYIGLNGIMTFTTDQNQLEAAKNVPVEKLLLETDAPFLTPKPFRGRINTPKHVTYITKFLSELRDEPQALLAKQTTQNAKKLFNL